MKQHSIYSHFGWASVVLLSALFAPGLNGWQPVHAATPISTQPIFITPTSTDQVKPNIFMVLDDSGSMDWDFMPDVARNFDQDWGGNKKFGFASSQCNGVYYNPNITYSPPVDAAGASYPDSSFTAAKRDGFDAASTTVDLSTSFRAFGSDTSQAAYYYKYSGTQTAESQKKYYTSSSIFYKECNSLTTSTTAHDGTNPVNTVFTKVVVSATSGPGGTDERKNFANWYTYYRTRMQMMKTATGLAFKSIDDNFRVGFMTLHGNASPGFLNISDFTQTQKDSFYTNLYASNPNNGTPLRATLSKAGRMYAGKQTAINGVTVVDPVQYSCQQNYTILSTDGFWNGDGGIKLDGSAIENEDSKLPRPYFDGASITRTVVRYYKRTKDQNTITTTTSTQEWRKAATTLGAACKATTVTDKDSSLYVGKIGGTNYYGAVGYASVDLSGNSFCQLLGGSGTGAGGAGWFCLRTGSGTYPAGFTQNYPMSTPGKTWYQTTNAGQADCKKASAYSSKLSGGACAEVAGTNVVTTTYKQVQSSVQTDTSLDRYEATQTTTETITNGVTSGEGPLSPSTPSYTKTGNLGASTSTTVTCAGVAGNCPNDAASWSTVNTVTQCTANSALPTPGSTLATLFSSSPGTPSSAPGSIVATTSPTFYDKTENTVTSGGTSDTLADAAAYYYNTALRTTALGNCTPGTAKNNLCNGGPTPTTDDPATWQHMTTFTVGLGVRGQMVYSKSYAADAANSVASDYTDVFYGKNATSATTCTWRDTLTTAGAACNWPVPVADSATAVDDLWHAAVNGHGKYYSATDPNELANGLAQTLKFIVDQPKPGTAASAATTNPKVTENNNYQFSSFFLSVEWSGDLIRQTKDLTTGKPPVFDLMKREPGTFDWSARDQLDVQTYANRKIYFKGSSGLSLFNWANVTTESLQNYFTAPHISTTPPGYPNQLTGLTQFCATGSVCIASTAQSNTTVATGGAAGEALVNFLRGDRSNEESTVPDTSKFYRHRAHVLGDIVSAQPQYSGAPKWNFSDSGYAAYKSANASRLPLVFAAANDGMLHAFNASTGVEVWAYIPSFVLPRLYTLADKNYSDKHQYFVEGTPQIGDICPKAPAATCSSSEWKTIIVGGLNGGGTGYYALDITDPNNPALLWEFTHDNMGYTFGNPQITKMDDGTWVTLVTSGYNNCPKLGTAAQQDCANNGTGDGRGYLYVLKAGTGELLAAISTAEGSVTAPSGLGKIVAHEDATNVSRRVYGGDLNGNLWRFSIGTGGYTAHKLATLQDVDNVAQPIMDKPQVTTINSLLVVYVGTGRYLSTSDVGGTPKQSFYAIKDPLNTTFYGSPRSSTNFVRKTAVDGTCPDGTDIAVCSPGDKVRTLTQSTGVATDSLANKDGWIVDFPAGAGELAFTDPKLVLGTITFTTSIPSSLTSTDVCRSSTSPTEGTSFLYMLDYLNGGAVGNSNGVAAASLGQGIATSPQYSQLQDGSVIITTRMSGGNDVFTKGRFNTQSATAKRVSWRELVSE